MSSALGGLHIDEQEATRFLLLSPEINQEKIRASILASIQKESDRDLYNESLEKNLPRIQITERIRAIRDEKILEISLFFGNERCSFFNFSTDKF